MVVDIPEYMLYLFHLLLDLRVVVVHVSDSHMRSAQEIWGKESTALSMFGRLADVEYRG